ncbi:hypothetical protein T10_4786 [Trichinella papuae]|uniref:Uncharacterized protein n=1 Tax=Trichinella papuae TaxID=268474 RepID=A0A0V1M3G2_9BILA|nr:hypothetical protein T10_4786 [Trichinella papuae]
MKGRKKKPEPFVPRNSKQRKRAGYLKIKEAHNKDPKRAVSYLFYNQPLDNVSCPVESGKKAFRPRMGKRPPIDCAPLLPKPHFPEGGERTPQTDEPCLSIGPRWSQGVPPASHWPPMCLQSLQHFFTGETHPPGPEGLSDHSHPKSRQSPARC